MPDTNPATTTDLPSSRTLLRSTLIAIAVAMVLLVTVVMPAEYGVDPTGVGGVLGLTPMGEIKVSLAKEAATADSIEAAVGQGTAVGDTTVSPPAASAAAPAAAVSSPAAAPRTPPGAPPAPSDVPAPISASPAKSHVTEITLLPNEGKEIKLLMRKDARVTYSWSTDRGVVNYDTHADAPGISYHGYAKGSGKRSDEGVLIAAFDGAHGWFWRNRGSEPVTVTLRTNGDYLELKRM